MSPYVQNWGNELKYSKTKVVLKTTNVTVRLIHERKHTLSISRPITGIDGTDHLAMCTPKINISDYITEDLVVLCQNRIDELHD
jgi:hypothetical protein